MNGGSNRIVLREEWSESVFTRGGSSDLLQGECFDHADAARETPGGSCPARMVAMPGRGVGSQRVVRIEPTVILSRARLGVGSLSLSET